MKDWQSADKKFIWHPFTQMKEWMAEDQIVIERGENEWLVDTEGRRYIDGVSSLWCNVHGHRRREIDEAVRAQLDKIAHSTMLGLTHTASVELSERLAGIAPEGLTRIFYSDSGSEAAEIALKMAFQYQRHRGCPEKSRFVALQHSYHGDTIGSVSVGGIELFHSLFRPLLFDAAFVPCPARKWNDLSAAPAQKMEESLAAVEDMFKREGDEIAALIMEPLVQGAGGIIVHPPGFLREVRALCTKYDVLLIADEVAVGFGRTGRMFACEHEGVSPDIMTVAKGLTGGYLPLAATLVREDIFERFLGEFSDHKTFFHGHTYTANPLACAAATASIDIFEKDSVLEKLRAKIDLLSELLAPLKSHPNVGEVRQCGFIAGVELAADAASGRAWPEEMRAGWKVCLDARKGGVLVRPLGDVIVIMPPLSICEESLKKLIEVISGSIESVCGGGKL